MNGYTTTPSNVRRAAVAAVGVVAALALAASAGTTSAGAAGTAGGTSKRFIGSGAEYANNGPRWEHSGSRSRISFHAVSGERRLVSFSGTYSYYCGGGTGTITDKSIRVASNGRFSARGHFPDRTSSGRVTAENYVSLWGRLIDHGNAAVVSFLVDAVYAGKHVANPYSTRLQRPGLACETLVKGRASAVKRSGAVRRGRTPRAALGATPAVGCFGTCGGDQGPVDGFFVVSDNRKQVQQFANEDKCLGTRSIGFAGGQHVTVGDELMLPTMAVHEGRFHFKGTGKVYAGGAKMKHVHAVLDGRFTTARVAVVVLKLAHAGCSTIRQTIKEA